MNDSGFFDDLMFVSNTVIGICILSFIFNISRPIVLLLVLEVAYMCINLQLILLFVYLGFFYGPAYSLLCLGISAVETLVGLSLIVQMYRLNIFSVITKSQ